MSRQTRMLSSISPHLHLIRLVRPQNVVLGLSRFTWTFGFRFCDLAGPMLTEAPSQSNIAALHQLAKLSTVISLISQPDTSPLFPYLTMRAIHEVESIDNTTGAHDLVRTNLYRLHDAEQDPLVLMLKSDKCLCQLNLMLNSVRQILWRLSFSIRARSSRRVHYSKPPIAGYLLSRCRATRFHIEPLLVSRSSSWICDVIAKHNLSFLAVSAGN